MESLIEAYKSFDFSETVRVWEEFAAKHCQNLESVILSVGNEPSGELSPITRAV